MADPTFPTLPKEIVFRFTTFFSSNISPTGRRATLLIFIRRRPIDLGALDSEALSLEEVAHGFRLADLAETGRICFKLQS